MNFRTLVFAATACGIMFSFSSDAADAKKGKKVFRKCVACHSITKGARHKVGPNLFGIFGRSSGKAPRYTYSKAMKSENLIWDEETLHAFVKNPKKVVKKTKMSFAGLRNDGQRADLIAYLKTQSD